jgi:hypothetical protein
LVFLFWHTNFHPLFVHPAFVLFALNFIFALVISLCLCFSGSLFIFYIMSVLAFVLILLCFFHPVLSLFI